MSQTSQARVESAAPAPQKQAIDKLVFGVAAVLSIILVACGGLFPKGMDTGTSSALGWITNNFAWLFVLASAFFLAFSIWLAMSHYGLIKLGKDDDEPEFSTFSWISMMFATGMGIGLMFYGIAEPLTHLNAPPLDLAQPGTPAASQLAMEYTFFHWGLHPWSMYAIIGLIIAYFAYRRGTGNLISGTFTPLLGKGASSHPAGKTIDIVAIFATLFGSATSLGLGALQITGGLGRVFGMSTESKLVAILVIAVLTACFVLSAVSGVDKGIQWLSNANAIAAALLALFLFLVGPTVFILGTLTESLGGYLTHLPAMSFRTGSLAGHDWISGWTIFYWAWWMSWTPFVGMFIARISKGRTIRQFVVCVILVPTLVSCVWFSILGGSAFDLQLNQHVDMAAELAIGQENALFATLEHFPLTGFTTVVAIFLIAIFFVTGADSASIVMGMLSQRGEEEPKRLLVIFWGVATGAVAAVLLSAGGLEALQRVVIIIAFPFMLILILMCYSLVKALREESLDSTLRPRLRKAVKQADRYLADHPDA